MDVAALETHFGVKLATGETCAPGVLMNVNSSGEGRVANNGSGYVAHGVATTSGAGTKIPGISQYVRLNRTARVVDIGKTLTLGAVVYMNDGGGYQSAAPGTTDQKVGFALAADEAFIDLDLVGI